MCATVCCYDMKQRTTLSRCPPSKFAGHPQGPQSPCAICISCTANAFHHSDAPISSPQAAAEIRKGLALDYAAPQAEQAQFQLERPLDRYLLPLDRCGQWKCIGIT